MTLIQLSLRLLLTKIRPKNGPFWTEVGLKSGQLDRRIYTRGESFVRATLRPLLRTIRQSGRGRQVAERVGFETKQWRARSVLGLKRTLGDGSANCCIPLYNGCLNRCRVQSKTDYQRNL